MMQWNEVLKGKGSFDRAEMLKLLREAGIDVGESYFKKRLQELLRQGQIVRVGRNIYAVPQNGERIYSYEYSELANGVADLVKEAHPYLEFSITELVQVNEFVNHQLAHNIVFLSVEEEIADFVFDTLKEYYPGKVLLNPTVELFHQYWYDNMIVIGKLITEAPKGKNVFWQARLEKLLVDLFTEPLWMESVSAGELPTIYEDAFSRYVIDESCLFRYAKRRTAEKRIREFIAQKTTVKLRTEE